MTTKEKVFEYLKKSGASYISGQQIAEDIFVSRAAVWKAINTLKKEGYNIEAVTNKGYRLVEKVDIPDAGKIMSYIEELCKGKEMPEIPEIIVYESLESTNDTAKEIYKQDSEKEAIIIAGMQTKGKGRRGRSFYSPDKTGVYITFLLHPKMDFTKAVRLTCMKAVAVCNAAESCLGLDVGIKWVNDIIYRDKKVAGILTEGATSFEDGTLSYVIIGTGINLYEPYEGFPEEIKKIAGALLDSSFDNDTRNRFIAHVIIEFMKLYRSSEEEFIEAYKKRSVLIGHYVKVLQHAEDTGSRGNNYAKVTGIDNECRLLVEYENGKKDALSSGEVSVVKY